MTQHLIFITIALDQMAGGLERNFLRVANYFAELDYKVSVISFDQPGARAFYPVHPKIIWHQVGTAKPHGPIGFWERWQLLKNMRQVIRQNENKSKLVVAFHHGILARIFLATLGLGLKIICSERNALSLYQHVRTKKWNLNFFLLGFTHKITVLFDSYRNDYPTWMRHKIVTIPNYVDGVDQGTSPNIPTVDGRYTMISVGRLCDQKQFNLLIDAFAQIANDHSLWDLKIYGSGGLKNTLQDQINSLGLSSRIFLMPEEKDIQKIYRSGHLYVVTSKWEGFPNALAEAMAYGVPAIGFKDCRGVCDLIQDAKTGFLVKRDTVSLAEKISFLITQPDVRECLGQAGRLWMASYQPEPVLMKWRDLIRDVGGV